MDLNAHVKSVIESMTCPEHGQKPTVLIKDNSNNIDMFCCCTEFKIACLRKMTGILIDHKDKTLKLPKKSK